MPTDTSLENMASQSTVVCDNTGLTCSLVNHIGPQRVFPVRKWTFPLIKVHSETFSSPAQGILDYKGENTLAVSLWAMKPAGAKLNSLKLQLSAKIESSLGKISVVPAPKWTSRPGAY